MRMIFSVMVALSLFLGRTNAQSNVPSLEIICKKAAESHSDAVLIFKNDKPVLEWYAGNKPPGPIELMSCTKSIVNLAIGRLIDTGKIKSLDQPIYEFYPEWKQGKKQLITLRHLLNHTSGLQNNRDSRVELYPTPDLVKMALAAELSDEPGSRFSYNNKAVNLLAGIVQIASGKRLDKYCRDAFFRPMGIKNYHWMLDQAGNPFCMSGLQLTARDFARFGQLLLDKGMWNGTRLVSEKWIDDSLAQGQPYEPSCGLLWWRIMDVTFEIDDARFHELEAAGLDKPFLDKLTSLKNKTFYNRQDYDKALTETLGGDWPDIVEKETAGRNVVLSRKTYGKVFGYNANGYLGQYLVIYPDQRLVAVRQVRSSATYDKKTDGFDDFPDLVGSLRK
jgi:CubicO group peptidase (beta-lactamase class C family)